MTTPKWLFRVRENTLNTLLWINPAAALNTIKNSPEREMTDGSLAAEIKKLSITSNLWRYLRAARL